MRIILIQDLGECPDGDAWNNKTKAMARKYTYHWENCDCFIREVIVDVYGRRVILSGQHAFEYSITIISITGRIAVTNFKNGKEARKEFYKLKKKK